jgi:hypothetical protein
MKWAPEEPFPSSCPKQIYGSKTNISKNLSFGEILHLINASEHASALRFSYTSGTVFTTLHL